MSKKISFSLSERSEKKIKILSEELKLRKVKKPDLSELLNSLIEGLSEKQMKNYVEKVTPIEWKLAQALKSNEGARELEKALKKINLDKKINEKESELGAKI
jgi:hypothetical protein